MFRMAFYAVARGRQTGIFRSWSECESQVKGFSGPVFKKFKSHHEAQAFIEGQPEAKKQKTQAKINFAKTDEEIFLNLEEYPDAEPSTSKKKETPASSSEPKRKESKGLLYEPPEQTLVKTYNGYEFNEDAKGFVHVYTDGSCESNGKFAAAAGLGVYFGQDHPLNVSEPVKGRPTNNAGEIQAAIRAIEDAQKCGIKRLKIFTDSQFVINSVCKWMSGWKRKGWRLATGKSVVNHVDFKRLDELIESGNTVIQWAYIPAHKGHHGNEEADKLAKIGASLFRNKEK